MYWEVVVPGDDGASSKTVTVQAENWFTALRTSLFQQGGGGQLISNLTCDIKPDKSVLVTDFVTRKVFTLRPLDGAPAPAAAPKAEAAPAAKPRAEAKPDPAVDGLPSDLPRGRAFFRRDEDPGDASGIFYRERMLAVDPATNPDDAGRLALVVFERLKGMGAPAGTKLFVTVQVFDHEFEGRFERPAIAALEWKEWSPKKAKILFPLSGAEELRFSRIPAAPAEAAPAEAAPVEAVPVEKKVEPKIEAKVEPKVEPKIEAKIAPKPIEIERRPADKRPSAEFRGPQGVAKDAPKKRQTGEGVVVDDVFFQAFERMHEIYSYRDHDKVAEFALQLAREFIKCEAGSSMLISPGKYELYVAAAQGEVASSLIGKRLSLTKGIVGFATRAGAVVTVSDPANDPRFHDEFDKKTNFKTRNVLCAPIQFEGKTIGAIELLNSPREAGFLQTEANVLSYIAGAVGEYIDTSLPSREAEFSDKEFAAFLPAKRAEALRRAEEKKTAAAPQSAPAAKPAPAPTPAVAAKPAPAVAAKPAVKNTMAETPAAKKVEAKPAPAAAQQDKSGAKNKKKRKR